MDNFDDCVRRKLIHIKNRPTYTTINNLIFLLKNLGYQNIPKLQTQNYFNISDEVLTTWSNQILELIEYEPDGIKKINNHTSKEIFMFPESNLLPKNVYLSEKDNEDLNPDDNFLDDISSISESEHSGSDKEEHEEEGYAVYEEESDEEWSV